MIIGLSGYAKAGKSEVANILSSIDSSWQVKGFSVKLKEVASILTGHPSYKFEDQEFKKTFLGPEWNVLGLRISVRDFLQRLGTEGLRQGVHDNAWVNALMADYIGTYNLDTDRTTYPNWIITDCRFPNEAKAITERGGIIVRINRTGIGPVNDHPSETSLDDHDFDFVIENSGDITFLTESVKALIKLKL